MNVHSYQACHENPATQPFFPPQLQQNPGPEAGRNPGQDGAPRIVANSSGIWGSAMIAILCAFLSAAGFYLAFGHGAFWPLAWIAPVPVLWLGFGDAPRWQVFAAASASSALGACNILPDYAGILPSFVLVLAVAGPALLFAFAVLFGARAAKLLSPLAGALAFAMAWTGWDYLTSLLRNGAPPPSVALVGAPWAIQGASVFGPWIVTFLLGFVAAGIAVSLRKRQWRPVLAAVILFTVNAGFGVWRLGDAAVAPVTRIGLAADDSLVGAARKPGGAQIVANAYANTARLLAHQGATLIVFPEKLAVLKGPQSAAALEPLRAAARETHTTIVIGFDSQGPARRNEALIFTPDGAAPQAYFKRHMVEGLEDAFVPGDGGFVLPDRTGVAICKDMDFPATLRADAVAAHPTLLAVPAWDFGGDGWWHARLAILRGVENGFALARAANDGLLTLTDAYGRVVTLKPSAGGGMVTLIGDLPRGPGRTPYQILGDAFAWACIAGTLLLLGLLRLRRQ
jgi:apolipoprotein N-acyltransferase